MKPIVEFQNAVQEGSSRKKVAATYKKLYVSQDYELISISKSGNTYKAKVRRRENV